MRIEPDTWLAGIFGYPTFKVSRGADPSQRLSPSLSVRTLCESACGQAAFFYAKIPTARVDDVRMLGAAGFTVVDVNVTFEREPAELPDWQAGHGAIIRDLLPADFGTVCDIAASCFVYSRFHLDPLIPNTLANAVKRAWIESYCHRRRGECLLVAELDGKVVGFNAILATAINEKSVRVIDLIGVDSACQGRGVGRQLVNNFVHSSAGRAAAVRVGTQAANVPSMRLYERCGFNILDTMYVMHAHVLDGEVLR